MKLPADYLDLVSTGAAVLRAVGAELRLRAAAQPNAPELWLSVRDYEGLAGRLAASDDWEWRRGFAGLFITGQDFGVLDELLAQNNDSSVLLSEEQASALARLRNFLRQYRDREFELQLPNDR